MARSAGFIPPDRATAEWAGKSEGQSAEGRCCGLKSALLPALRARSAGFIPQDRAREEWAGKSEGQSVEGRCCVLKSALLPALRAGARDLSRRTARGRRAQGGSNAKLLRNGPADSSPRSFPRCALGRGIYPAGTCEGGRAQTMPHTVPPTIVPADSSPRSPPAPRGAPPAWRHLQPPRRQEGCRQSHSTKKCEMRTVQSVALSGAWLDRERYWLSQPGDECALKGRSAEPGKSVVNGWARRVP